MMKKCRRCNEIKDENKFGKRATSKDGLDSRCLICIKECSKLSADKNRIKNSGGIIILNKVCTTCRLEKTADCFGTNPGSTDGLRHECKYCRNIKSRLKYETDNNFRENESIRAYKNYLEDREYILNRTKLWSKNNPDKKVEQSHRRRARLYGQTEFNFPNDFVKLLRVSQNNKCAYCARDDIKLTIEHMLPISRGGKHCFDNIILACTNCNSSKRDKTLEEWLNRNKNLQKIGIKSDFLEIICDNIIKLIKINEK